ncbi:MAG: hypothetical protein ABIG10_01060 [bacterium]
MKFNLKSTLLWSIFFIILINLFSCGSIRPSRINERDDKKFEVEESQAEKEISKNKLSTKKDSLYYEIERNNLIGDTTIKDASSNNTYPVLFKKNWKIREHRYIVSKSGTSETVFKPKMISFDRYDGSEKTLLLKIGEYRVKYQEKNNAGGYVTKGSRTFFITSETVEDGFHEIVDGYE